MSTPDPFAAFEPERTVIKPKPRLAGNDHLQASALPKANPRMGEPAPMDLASVSV